jgi:hypothetical protein
MYSGRKITASFGNVTVRGEKRWKGQGGSKMANSLSMYCITENIYYSQLSSVAILLQPEPNCFTSYNTRKRLGYLSLCAIVLRSSPPSHVSTCNGQRSSQLFCVNYTTWLEWCVQCALDYPGAVYTCIFHSLIYRVSDLKNYALQIYTQSYWFKKANTSL